MDSGILLARLNNLFQVYFQIEFSQLFFWWTHWNYLIFFAKRQKLFKKKQVEKVKWVKKETRKKKIKQRKNNKSSFIIEPWANSGCTWHFCEKLISGGRGAIQGSCLRTRVPDVDFHFEKVSNCTSGQIFIREIVLHVAQFVWAGFSLRAFLAKMTSSRS